MAKRKDGPTPVETYRHDEKRSNIPTEELRGFVEDDESSPQTCATRQARASQSPS